MSITVGDTADKWELHLYSDADLAKCPFTKRSTSGVYAEIIGPNTRAAIIGHSARQTATSWSTPEAELVAAALAIQKSGIPLIELMESALKRKVLLLILEVLLLGWLGFMVLEDLIF